MRCGLHPLIFYEPLTSGPQARQYTKCESVNPGGEVRQVAVSEMCCKMLWETYQAKNFQRWYILNFDLLWLNSLMHHSSQEQLDNKQLVRLLLSSIIWLMTKIFLFNHCHSTRIFIPLFLEIVRKSLKNWTHDRAQFPNTLWSVSRNNGMKNGVFVNHCFMNYSVSPLNRVL